MTFNYKINVELEINVLEDLEKLREIVEVNNLEKPNFTQLGKEIGADRRTVKKYYDNNHNKERKQRESMLDDYYELIKSLLGENSIRKFYYKSHLYRFLVREHSLKCSRSNFNYYILQKNEFSEYFKLSKKKDAVKSEKPFGKQAQFDWKEKIKFTFKDNTVVVLNVGSLILSASRYKVWSVYLSTSQEYLFDFLAKSFEQIGGVPEEILVDNASTMMDVARTEKKEGKINIRFQQFANDFGFNIVPCVRARPQTKAKVENPMRIIDEIRNYNGELKDMIELKEKLAIITNETNMRICQATDIVPMLALKKEKKHLLPLPSSKICSSYKTIFKRVIIKSNSLFEYNKNMYSVPSELIGKSVTIEKIDNQLYVYYNRKLTTIHQLSEKKINYQEKHHLEMITKTFPNEENIKEVAQKHLAEMEKFNEQLSSIT